MQWPLYMAQSWRRSKREGTYWKGRTLDGGFKVVVEKQRRVVGRQGGTGVDLAGASIYDTALAEEQEGRKERLGVLGVRENAARIAGHPHHSAN